jgi:hypothetical protein
MVTSGNLQFIARHDFCRLAKSFHPTARAATASGDRPMTMSFRNSPARPAMQKPGSTTSMQDTSVLGRFTSPDTDTDPTGMDTVYMPFAGQGCPAEMANCPMPCQPVVGTPAVPNEINSAEARYVQEVVIPGFLPSVLEWLGPGAALAF